MQQLQQAQRAADKAVCARRDFIIDLGRDVYAHPETGFKEQRTAQAVAQRMRHLGLEPEVLEEVPAVRAVIDTGRPGPVIAIMGEMDALLCAGHPDATPDGVVHACGHHGQLAALLGAAAGLLEGDVLGGMCGKIILMAVPAEEYIELAYRSGQRQSGRLHYLGGKPELLYRGWFDGVDMAMMIHLGEGDKVEMHRGSVGCLAKMARYQGVASHAGGSPQNGINALYAATLGLSAINAVRETFMDSDQVRVHPIMTKGGDVVNVIPDDVRIETFVRARTVEAMQAAAEKVDRALGGGAYSMGASVTIDTLPGYLPYTESADMQQLLMEYAGQLWGFEPTRVDRIGTGSSDVGDLSTLMPVFQPYIGGVGGALHTVHFSVVDEDIAYVLGGRLLATMAVALMAGDGARARDICQAYRPIFASIPEYLAFQNALYTTRTLP
nr:amidohydrolase [bacterium]